MLKRVGQWLVEKAGSTLSGFATHVCEKCNFMNNSGKPQTGNFINALKQLDKQGLIDLQKSLNYTPLQRKIFHNPKCLQESLPQPVAVPGNVDDIVDLRVEIVSTFEDKMVLNTLLRDEHYLGAALPPGRRISYLIKSEYSLLGAVCFSSAANRLMSRDTWIGWSDQVRKENLDCVLNMSRLLIRPSVNCKNLDSKVISISSEIVQKDCLEQYGFSPYLIETFVDPEKCSGTCYTAAGWELVGETKGRGWNDQHHSAHLSKKLIFVKTLVPDFRDQLKAYSESEMSFSDSSMEYTSVVTMGTINMRSSIIDPCPTEEAAWVKKGALQPTEGLTVHEWANLEFGASNLGHQDRNTRLIKSAETICMRPHYSANVAFQGDPSGSKGWYRFIATNQEKVSFDSILSGPMECTCRYMMSQDTVLIAQDDTKLNFTSKPQIAGMGSIGTNQTNAETSGCILHTLMAITTEGIPLGIVKSTCFTRHNKSEDENSKKRSPEEKESFVWIEHARYINQVGQYMQNTKIIMLCDRGADIALFIYETFYMKNCDLIVRAKNDRRVPGETQSSFALLQKEKPAGCIQVTVPRRSERPKLSGKAAVAGRKERKKGDIDYSL